MNVQSNLEKAVDEPRFTRFWSSASTAAAMRMLDIWASVWIARKGRQYTIPKADAIFATPIPNLPEWIDPTSGLRIIDWASYRVDQTAKVDSPEALVFYAIERLLKDQSYGKYLGILLTYFPRTGVYKSVGVRLILPGEMPQADQIAIREVIHAIKRAEGDHGRNG